MWLLTKKASFVTSLRGKDLYDVFLKRITKISSISRHAALSFSWSKEGFSQVYGYAVLSLLAHVSVHGSYCRVFADPMFHSSALATAIHLTDTNSPTEPSSFVHGVGYRAHSIWPSYKSQKLPTGHCPQVLFYRLSPVLKPPYTQFTRISGSFLTFSGTGVGFFWTAVLRSR